MPEHEDEILIRIYIWIAENIFKLVFGGGLIVSMVKVILMSRSIQFISFLTLTMYGKRYRKHKFYQKATQIKNEITFYDIDIQPERIELAKHILTVEYNMLYNYTIEMVNWMTVSRKVKWYNYHEKYEYDSEVIRAYMVKHLNIMRLQSMKGLKTHDVPEAVIKKYSQYRNIIYDSIDQIIYTICTEYKFTPLIVWAFLNSSYVLFTQMKTVIVYFVRSLNGELRDSKFYPPFPEIEIHDED